jgi:two-component system chemotaxis response regulator CheY
VGKKILIVEDSPTMRSLICSAIAMMGDYAVVEAENGFEALRMLPKHQVSMVITDINMPDINGLELIKFIRSNDNYKGLPVVIVSTEGSDKDRHKGLSLGADAYLVKPFVPIDLQNLIRKFLG